MSRQLVLAAVVAVSACAPRGAVTHERPPEGGAWRTLADAPLSPRLGHVAVWTGREMVVWGGATQGPEAEGVEYVPASNGAAYNPESDSWRPLAKAPIPGGGGYSAVWTGSEVILWGAPRWDVPEAHGAAYDPRADRWRPIAPSPLPARSGVAVWTGREMVVWGGSLAGFETERYDGRGAAYDPASDSWRELPPGPLPAGYDAMGVWTGREVVLLATPLEEPRPGRPQEPVAAAYDPQADSWRRLARPPMAAAGPYPPVLLDGEMLLLSATGPVDGGEVDPFERPYDTGGIYDVAADVWRPHAYPSVHVGQIWLPVATREEVVLNGLAYHPATDSWRRLPAFPLQAREFPSVVWTGQELIVWGGAELEAAHSPPLLDDGAAYRSPAA